MPINQAPPPLAKRGQGLQKINQLLNNRKQHKAPAYPWQELSLKVIKEINVPQFKKSAVFKVCRNLPKNFILQCLIDTNELAKAGEKWKYFFKLINQYDKNK